ncbi:MAG: hypothetical protein JWN96_412, partial [Mycobacterium sp.]|nr:hypothetical protein [Mycobacterium sp.]
CCDGLQALPGPQDCGVDPSVDMVVAAAVMVAAAVSG